MSLVPPDDRIAQLQHEELQVGREVVVTADPIRIVLVGMVRLYRDGLANALSAQPDLEIVGEFDDVDSALEAIEGKGANVVIASPEAFAFGCRPALRGSLWGIKTSVLPANHVDPRV